ncbi:hypothetical protein [Halocatena marina]|nr:hypothetical protein [Halocatena marina]
MIDQSPTGAGDAISSGTHRVLAIDPIEETDGVLSLIAVYRHFAPDDHRFALYTFRFRYTTNRKGEYLLDLDEWCPPDQPVSAQHPGMLTYLDAYFASYEIHVSMAVPVFGPDDRADNAAAERFSDDSESQFL